MEKNELRRELTAHISALTAEERASAAEKILERVTRLPEWERAEVLLGYLAMPGEASVDGVLAHALRSGKRVGVPVVTEEGLLFRELDSLDESLSRGAFGIREPGPECPIVNVEEVRYTIMLVPGLGFDLRGGRLGRGGGYYDRVLQGRGDTVIAVAVGFACQVVKEVPAERHDQWVDAVVTEAGIYRF